MNEELIDDLFAWVDKIPFSRPKKDLKRDFSDGVLIAEVVKFYYPNYVDLHNYPSALGVNNKIINWKTLNRKVFRKLKFEISEDVIKSIVTCQPNAIQQFLLLLRCKIEAGLANSDIETTEVHLNTASYAEPHLEDSYARNNEDANKKAMKEKGDSQLDTINTLQTKLLSLEMALVSKDETIDILKAKVKKLENLLDLKDLRLTETDKK